MRSEAVLTKKLLHNTAAGFLAESGIEEAVLHIRKQMNQSGASNTVNLGGSQTSWYEVFRKPVSEISGKEVFENFSANNTNAIIQDRFGEGSSCEVTIFFDKFDNFQNDPAPDPAGIEKFGVLRFYSKVKLDKAEVNVEVKKDIKVLSLALPNPLKNYTLWLWETPGGLGTRSLNSSQQLNSPSITEPLDLNSVDSSNSDYKVMQGTNSSSPSWKFIYGQSEVKKYPLCKQKISYYFDTIDEGDGLQRFKEYFFSGNTYKLKGMTVIDSAQNIVNLSGQLKGKGKLIFVNSKVSLDNLTIDPDSSFQLATLKGQFIELNGYGGTPFKGAIAVPDGELYTSSNTKIKGNVYARKWNYSDSNRLEFKQDSGYLVTFSKQIVSWKRR